MSWRCLGHSFLFTCQDWSKKLTTEFGSTFMDLTICLPSLWIASTAHGDRFTGSISARAAALTSITASLRASRSSMPFPPMDLGAMSMALLIGDVLAPAAINSMRLQLDAQLDMNLSVNKF